MKRLGMAALAVGITLAMGTGSFAQTGRDEPKNGTSMDSQKSGSMGQKGTMQNNNMQNDNMKKGNMHNDTMQKGSSGTMNK